LILILGNDFGSLLNCSSKPGEFSHTLVDLHAYCGDGKDYGLKQRGQWYKENLSGLQTEMKLVKEPSDYLDIKEWIESSAPEESTNVWENSPGLYPVSCAIICVNNA